MGEADADGYTGADRAGRRRGGRSSRPSYPESSLAKLPHRDYNSRSASRPRSPPAARAASVVYGATRSRSTSALTVFAISTNARDDGRAVAVAVPDDGEAAARDRRVERDHLDAVVARLDREQRHQGDAEPRRDEALQGRVVVGAERVVERDRPARGARPRRPRRSSTGSSRSAPTSPRSASETRVARGERAVARDEQHVRIGEELDRVERPVGTGRLQKPRSMAPLSIPR